MALVRRISDANLCGHKSQVSIFTGASTGPELDGALAMGFPACDGVEAHRVFP
jgi:succinyl-CoA:acetate CoA-transferase